MSYRLVKRCCKGRYTGRYIFWTFCGHVDIVSYGYFSNYSVWVFFWLTGKEVSGSEVGFWKVLLVGSLYTFGCSVYSYSFCWVCNSRWSSSYISRCRSSLISGRSRWHMCWFLYPKFSYKVNFWACYQFISRMHPWICDSHRWCCCNMISHCTRIWSGSFTKNNFINIYVYIGDCWTIGKCMYWVFYFSCRSGNILSAVCCK